MCRALLPILVFFSLHIVEAVKAPDGIAFCSVHADDCTTRPLRGKGAALRRLLPSSGGPVHVRKARGCGAVMLGIQLDADIAAAKLLGGGERRAGTGEGVQYDT